MGIVALGVLGLGGWGLYEAFFKKKTTQGMATGTPGVFVVAPVPSSVTQSQATGVVTTPPSSGGVTATTKPGGIVYGPANAVQPGQSLPILVTPTGQSAIGLSSTSDVQRALNTLGVQPLLKVDGSLGPNTIANIKNFQSSHGLPVDGNAGPGTKSALSAALSALAAGPKAPIGQAASTATPATAPNMSAKDIQHILNLLGANPPLKEDGVIGPKSVSAIKAFQVSHGLTPDGVAGPKTKAALALASSH